jgi:flagellar protein FliO/FliZ
VQYQLLLTGINGIVQLITVAVLFIVVLVMTYFTTRFIGNYQKGHMSCNNIQIVETMRLSQNKLIQIVHISDKYFAIAVCKDTVTLLGELDGSDIIVSPNNVTNERFESVLNRFRKKEQNNKQEDR